MTNYTAEADIEAIGERKRFFAWIEAQNSNDLIGYEALFSIWQAALAASPVHAELERVRDALMQTIESQKQTHDALIKKCRGLETENERLREDYATAHHFMAEQSRQAAEVSKKLQIAEAALINLNFAQAMEGMSLNWLRDEVRKLTEQALQTEEKYNE